MLLYIIIFVQFRYIWNFEPWPMDLGENNNTNYTWGCTECRLNIEMPSYQHRAPKVKDKPVSQEYCLYNGNSYTQKEGLYIEMEPSNLLYLCTLLALSCLLYRQVISNQDTDWVVFFLSPTRQDFNKGLPHLWNSSTLSGPLQWPHFSVMTSQIIKSTLCSTPCSSSQKPAKLQNASDEENERWFPSQRASDTKSFSMLWRHYGLSYGSTIFILKWLLWVTVTKTFSLIRMSPLDVKYFGALIYKGSLSNRHIADQYFMIYYELEKDCIKVQSVLESESWNWLQWD